MFRVALGNIFVERYAEQFSEPGGNERGEVALFVATLGGGNDAPVAISERAAEYLTDEFCDVGSEKLDHIGVALDVGQRPAIERLFPERDDTESGITVVSCPMEALSEAMELLAAHEVDLSKTIHHSNRGVQYTCADYVTELHKNKVMISMTESGNPKDNAEAERINNTLKNELFKDMVFTEIGQVKEALRKAVMFYNYERPHLSLELRTPAEAAAETGRFKRQWISYRERAIDAMRANDENETDRGKATG